MGQSCFELFSVRTNTSANVCKFTLKVAIICGRNDCAATFMGYSVLEECYFKTTLWKLKKEEDVFALH